MSFQSLGQTKTIYKFDGPFPDFLESFPSPRLEPSFQVIFETDEFTSLCPVTGQPDYGTVEITYTPDKVCVESKSLKLYLMSFRQFGGFGEAITNRIFEDLQYLLKPRALEVTCRFKARGGINFAVTRML